MGLVLLFSIVAISCGNTRGAVRTFPQYVDDVARELGIARTAADDIIRQTADDFGLTRAAVVERILPQADTIRPLADDIDTVVANLRQRADEPVITLEDYVASVLCGELLNTIDQGRIATPDEMYDRSVEAFGEAIADELWELGWLHDVEDVVVALEEGDEEGSAMAVTEALYC